MPAGEAKTSQKSNKYEYSVTNITLELPEPGRLDRERGPLGGQGTHRKSYALYNMDHIS